MAVMQYLAMAPENDVRDPRMAIFQFWYNNVEPGENSDKILTETEALALRRLL